MAADPGIAHIVLAVPAPGISVLFSEPLIIISSQLALGRKAGVAADLHPSAINGAGGLRGVGGPPAARDRTFRAACPAARVLACE
jgi:hypothetical protein